MALAMWSSSTSWGGLTTQKSWLQKKANCWLKEKNIYLAYGIVWILDHHTIPRKYQRAFRNPPKCSNHLTECKKGGGRQHTTFTLCQNAACSTDFISGGYIIFWVLRFDWINVIFAACFMLRGHDTDIDFLRLLFLVGMVCALTREFSLTSFET